MTEECGEGILHSAPAHAVFGVIVGLSIEAVLSLVFSGPLWNEDFALLMGLLALALYVEENL